MSKRECYAYITEKKTNFLRGDVWKLQSPSRQCEKCTWGVKDIKVREGMMGVSTGCLVVLATAEHMLGSAAGSWADVFAQHVGLFRKTCKANFYLSAVGRVRVDLPFPVLHWSSCTIIL